MRTTRWDAWLGAVRRAPRRRVVQRYSVHQPVAIIADGASVQAVSLDLSLLGMALQVGARPARSTPPPGASIALRLQTGPEAERLALSGVVAWRQGRRLGIAFDAPSARQLWVLHRMLP